MKGQRILMGILAVGLGLLLTLAAGLALAQGPGSEGNMEIQAVPVGTGFTYQGRLTDGGSPANGSYDFRFELYDDATAGSQVGSSFVKDDVTVTDGLFTVELDFGSDIFTGDARYLEIGVRPGASTGAYTTLTPRQALTPAPYALALPGLWTQQNATSPNVIGGYSSNSVTAGVEGATIGGGGNSVNTNQVTANYATIGGGEGNTASGFRSTVGGGHSNVITSTAWYATIGGGGLNTASGWAATVGGGDGNRASGQWATVPGGLKNTAQGNYSFAAGRRAKANHQGAFVWADSTDADFASTANDQFAVRANGGVVFSTGGASFQINGGDAWTSANDGSGSGLDADLLDGQDSSHYLDTLRGLSCSNGQVAKWNSTTSQWECGNDNTGGAGGDFWSLTGNAGTSGSNFLGTTDNQALELRVNNARALRLEPNAYSPNLIGGSISNSVTSGVVGATIGGGGAADDGWGNPVPNRVTNDYGTVGGGRGNTAGEEATVGGGWNNTASGVWAAIGGGQGNTVSSQSATVGGGAGNTASETYATVAGGNYNIASGEYATVGGGNANTSSGMQSTVAGGSGNDANAREATIGGGAANAASGRAATIGGGVLNSASGDYVTIGGGEYITVTGRAATVAGGSWITITGDYAAVGGGQHNTISGLTATISGGDFNNANGVAASIGGGSGNTADGIGATIGGGISNVVTDTCPTVGGGLGNVVTGTFGTVGGGAGNSASAGATTVGGGSSNEASADYATVGGGGYNTASGVGAVIAGGGGLSPWSFSAITNTASGGWSTISGGEFNTASGYNATVGGGNWNEASGDGATVGGGDSNTAEGHRATVGGGSVNTASGWAATVPGGDSNTAQGWYSFAAGYRAQAYHDGAFVWADSNNFDFASAGLNEFAVRATGGFYFVSSIDGFGNPWTGVWLPSGSGAWLSVSDRNAKTNFASVDGREILARLATMPIQTWNYKTQHPSIRHVGPVAQDFYAAFGVGEDELHISTVDADGVALAAIQGLHQVVQEKDAQIAAQQQRIDDLEVRVAALEQAAGAPRSSPSNLPGGWWPLFLGGLVVAAGVVVQRRQPGGER